MHMHIEQTIASVGMLRLQVLSLLAEPAGSGLAEQFVMVLVLIICLFAYTSCPTDAKLQNRLAQRHSCDVVARHSWKHLMQQRSPATGRADTSVGHSC